MLILTRESAIAYLSNVTVAPVTSTIRGVASEVALSEEDGMKRPCVINLHNIATVPKIHLGPMVATLSAQKLSEVCAAIGYTLGCV